MVKKLKSPNLFINREFSWLEFNDRVLQQGLEEELPLLERLKFLSIVSSNLDEFFMIRVAGLVQQKAAGLRKRDISGLTPGQQLKQINKTVHKMIDRHSIALKEVIKKLKDNGLCITEPGNWGIEQSKFLENYFKKEIFPALTPLAIQDLEPHPLLPGKQLNVAVAVQSKKAKKSNKKLILIPVPVTLGRFVRMPSQQCESYAFIEDVIAYCAQLLFEKDKILGTACIRITRDADVPVQADEAADLLGVIETSILERRHRGAVRLEISANSNSFIKSWLMDWLNLEPDFVYEINGSLDAAAFIQMADIAGFEKLKLPDWPPQKPKDLLDSQDIWQTLQQKDVLLFHPYESFEPVTDLLMQAATDPDVLAIKQTLYRTSSDSLVIKALKTAGENSKEVTVLVELKARFDEARNINWARTLEDAGCHVIYGIAGLKTHAKASLIIRREDGRIRRYVHLATGNYNEKTARLYSDIGLMTSDSSLTADIAAFFNLLTGSSEMIGWSRIAIAPTDIRKKLEDLIDREISISTPDKPGLIMAKMNSLEDKKMCQALYRASQAGVKVLLNIRGICCLRPGLKKISENIEVVSIVDRFLEHARIFYFANGGQDEIYLSSADWMSRNLDKRLEILFPVTSPKSQKRLHEILKTFFANDTKAYQVTSDGAYKRKTNIKQLSAQEKFYKEAVYAVQLTEHTKMKFIPLSKIQQ